MLPPSLGVTIHFSLIKGAKLSKGRGGAPVPIEVLELKIGIVVGMIGHFIEP